MISYEQEGASKTQSQLRVHKIELLVQLTSAVRRCTSLTDAVTQYDSHRRDCGRRR